VGIALLRDLQEYSDQELLELAASEVGDRKKAIAEEVLRRRHQQRVKKWLPPITIFSGLVSALAAGLVFMKKWFTGRGSR
jgi:hypothetical protein